MNTFALQRLNRLYEEPDDVFADFSDLFHKSVHPNQINSDYRFFYDRCDNIRAKKGKCVEEIISLQ